MEQRPTLKWTHYSFFVQAKQHLKAERLEEELAEGKKPEVVDDADSEDEDKYADRIDMPGQKFDTKRWGNKVHSCTLVFTEAELWDADNIWDPVILGWLGSYIFEKLI